MRASCYHPQLAMIVARRLVIGGRVQGVGFRWFTVEQARVENVAGFVRNLPDGRVEAFVEGDADSVDRFEHALRRGPRGARVDDVDAEPATPAGHRDFTIR
jgi:acylphosphatase